MNNSFHSGNFIFLINAASQVLTLSNIPAQSPSSSLPRPSQKVHQKGCIRLIFCVHPIGSVSPIITEFSQHDIIHFLEPIHRKGLHRIPIHQIEPVSCIQAADISE